MWQVAPHFGDSPRGRRHFWSPLGGGGGSAWVALLQAFPKHKEYSFLPRSPYLHDFLLMFWCYILLLTRRFFWCYFSHQVMATFGCVAQCSYCLCCCWLPSMLLLASMFLQASLLLMVSILCWQSCCCFPSCCCFRSCCYWLSCCWQRSCCC